jgi:hypothetical protein
MAWSITKTAKDVSRLYELASIFIHYGFGDVVEQLGLGRVLEQAGKALKWKEVEDFARLTAPQRARRAMEEMGPTFIKLGQILATRVDMFDRSGLPSSKNSKATFLRWILRNSDPSWKKTWEHRRKRCLPNWTRPR